MFFTSAFTVIRSETLSGRIHVKMNKRILSFSFLLLSVLLSGAGKEKVFLFSYFKGNGEDGLHLAYSRDGYNFTALNNDRSFLKPVVGISKLMRDPCIIRTDDDIFPIGIKARNYLYC